MRWIVILLLMSGSLSVAAQDWKQYDRNKDGKLSEKEAAKMLRDSGFFDQWDEQDDGYLSLQEWSDAIESNYPSRAGMATYANFMKWDLAADHYINKDEWVIGLFRWMDENSDEYVDQSEWEKWQP